MDLSSLGLREQPFSQPVLPDRMFEHPEASEIRARIHEVVARRGGLVTVTGEPGVGKTTVLQWALSTVSPPNRVVFLPFPVAGEDLLRRVAEALGLPGSGTPGSSVTLKVVRSALAAERDAAGGCVIVVIDQAHRVTDETLIMLGLLMAPVRDHESLMPVILVAQPDLERQLARLRKAGAVLPAAVSCRLGPLSATQVRAYVDAHVRRAGGDPSSLFEPDVASRLVANTSGIPRLINTICTESFRAAAAAGRTRISGALINQSARLEESEATPVSVLAQVRETWSAWRRRVADARATRSRWRCRVRGRATRSPGSRRVERVRAALGAWRQRVGWVRAALSGWRRPVGRVRSALSGWRPPVEPVRSALGAWCLSGWRPPVGRVRVALNAWRRPVGRVRVALNAWRRPVGRVRVALNAWRRPVGRVRVALNAWRRPVGRVRVALNAWRRPVGRVRAALNAWRRPVGRVRAALNAWRRPVGRVRVALNAWRRPVGRVRVALNAWRRPVGRVRVALNAWRRPVGRVRVALNAWRRPVGRVRAALSGWRPPVERARAALSGWRRPLGQVRAALGAWRPPVGWVRAALSGWRPPVGRARAALGAWRRPVGQVRVALSGWRPPVGWVRAALSGWNAWRPPPLAVKRRTSVAVAVTGAVVALIPAGIVFFHVYAPSPPPSTTAGPSTAVNVAAGRTVESSTAAAPVLSDSVERSAAVPTGPLRTRPPEPEGSPRQGSESGSPRVLAPQRESVIRQTRVKPSSAPERALLEAVEQGNVVRVQALLRAAASPGVHDADGLTPLMLAAIHGHREVARVLVDRGAPVNDRSARGSSPLMLAIMNRHSGIVRLLCDHGADVNARDQLGWTPLMHAAWTGDPEMVRLLLQRGADRRATDHRGWTAVRYARWRLTQSATGADEPVALLDPTPRAKPGQPIPSRASHAEVTALLGVPSRGLTASHQDAQMPLRGER